MSLEMKIYHDKEDDSIILVQASVPYRGTHGGKVKYMTSDIISLLKEKEYEVIDIIQTAMICNVSKDQTKGVWVFSVEMKNKNTEKNMVVEQKILKENIPPPPKAPPLNIIKEGDIKLKKRNIM